MRNVLVTLVAVSALVLGPAVVPAAAQNARALLQAADNAVGASKVNSIQYTGTDQLSRPEFHDRGRLAARRLEELVANHRLRQQVGQGRDGARARQQSAAR